MRFTLPGRVIILLLLVPLLSPSPAGAVAPDDAAESSLAVAAASDVQKVCRQARRLVQLGEPAAALQTIRDLRTAIATPPSGQDAACAGAFQRAVKRQARASALTRWATAALSAVGAQAADALDDENPTVSIPPRVPASCHQHRDGTTDPWQRSARASDQSDPKTLTRFARKAVESALRCDWQNKAAIALQEQLDAQSGLAERANKTWTDLKKAQLDPWVPLIVALLGMLALGLVLARVLLLLVTRDIATTLTLRDWMRPLLLTAGWLCLVAGAGMAVGAWTLISVKPSVPWPPDERDQLLLLLLAVAVGSAIAIARRPSTVARSATLDDRWDGPRKTSLVLLVLSGVPAGVLLVSRYGLQAGQELEPQLVLGALVGTGGSALLALGWSAGRALTITCSGDNAPKPEAVRTLIERMAPDSPRGAEVSQGTDASQLLSAIGVVETSSTPIVAAFIKAVKLMWPPTPWQLAVTATSTDNLACSLTHNHRLVDTFSEDRTKAFGFLEGVAASQPEAKDGTATADRRSEPVKPALPDLPPFAAALAIVTIATETHATKGLAGATRWRSVGLQFLAAQQPRGSETAKAMWAEAVSRDAKNLMARTGYWHALYRTAKESADLARYSQLLETLLTGDAVPQSDRALTESEPSLKLRLLYTRVVIGINRRAMLAEADVATEPTPQTLKEWAGELQRAVDNPDLKHDFRKEMKRRVGALLLSVPDFPNEELATAHPESEGPFVNYSLACFHANTANKGEDATVDFPEAVRCLKLADTIPAQATWRDEDPQLARLRDAQVAEQQGWTNPYRKQYGKTVPDNALSIPPFKEHADKLRAAGAITLEQIRDLPDRFDPTIRRSVEGWLKKVATFGIHVRDQPALTDWHMIIMSDLAARGISTHDEARATERLGKDLRKALLDYASSPSDAALQDWLNQEVLPED